MEFSGELLYALCCEVLINHRPCVTPGGSDDGALSSLCTCALVCLGHFSVSVQVHVWITHSPFEEQLRLFPATFTVCKSMLSISFYVFQCTWQLYLCCTLLLREILARSSSFPNMREPSAYTPGRLFWLTIPYTFTDTVLELGYLSMWKVKTVTSLQFWFAFLLGYVLREF